MKISIRYRDCRPRFGKDEIETIIPDQAGFNLDSRCTMNPRLLPRLQKCHPRILISSIFNFENYCARRTHFERD